MVILGWTELARSHGIGVAIYQAREFTWRNRYKEGGLLEVQIDSVSLVLLSALSVTVRRISLALLFDST